MARHTLLTGSLESESQLKAMMAITCACDAEVALAAWWLVAMTSGSWKLFQRFERDGLVLALCLRLDASERTHPTQTKGNKRRIQA